mgnify:CR=1 FL=1
MININEKAPDFKELDNRLLLPLKETTICFIIEQQPLNIYLIQHKGGNPIEFFEQQHQVFGVQDYSKLDKTLNYAHVASESLILLEQKPEQIEQQLEQTEQKPEQSEQQPEQPEQTEQKPEQSEQQLEQIEQQPLTTLKHSITEFIENQQKEEPQQINKFLEIEGDVIKIGELDYLVPKDVKEYIDFLQSENVRLRAQLYLTKGIED